MAERTFVPMSEAEVMRRILGRNFGAFLRFAFSVVSPHDVYIPNWHLDAIGKALASVECEVNKRLLINMPPRSMKSISVSVAWVAFLLGRDPSLRVIVVSYSQELAAKLHRDCRMAMEDPLYKLAFPKTRLKRATDTEIETTAGGGRLATSVSGVLTGRGADIIIIDDPIKPEDAHSETARKALNNWYGSTLASRLNSQAGGAIVLVMQRLHQDDLSGHVLAGGDFEHLKLPAIAVEETQHDVGRDRMYRRRPGEVLQPQRESITQLEALKAVMGAYNFSAQYQQEPVPLEGGLFKRKWLRFSDTISDPERPGQIVQSWDTATKTGGTNDFSVCVTARLRGTEIQILDVYRERLEFPDLQRAVIARALRFKADVLLIEDAASGAQLIQQLNALAPRGVPRPITCKPDRDKYSRAAGVSPQIEAGGLVLPSRAPWLSDFETELLAFPNGRFDDQVDALVQLMIWARQEPPDFEYDLDLLREQFRPIASPFANIGGPTQGFSVDIDPHRERDPNEVDIYDENRHPGATVRWGPLQI